jgi:hypothetical protein
MASLGKKIGYGFLQALGIFFDKKVVPPWVPWAIFGGIAILIAWSRGWDWWYLLRLISVILWILFALLVVNIIIRRIVEDRKAKK